MVSAGKSSYSIHKFMGLGSPERKAVLGTPYLALPHGYFDTEDQNKALWELDVVMPKCPDNESYQARPGLYVAPIKSIISINELYK